MKKFRAWDHWNEYFFYSEKEGLGKFFIMTQQFVASEHEVAVTQFIGRQDDFGNDLFEGDIVEQSFTTTGMLVNDQWLPVIGRGTKHDFKINIMIPDIESMIDNGKQLFPKATYYVTATYRLVGNKYENPELIPK